MKKLTIALLISSVFALSACATGDSAAISKTLSDKMNDSDTGATGSMFKSWLYRKLGMNDMAYAEDTKLGYGSKVTSVHISNPDGTSFPAVVRMHADGSVVYGKNMATGEELTPEQLTRAEQFMYSRKGMTWN